MKVNLLNYRKDGTPFSNALYISPVTSEDGELQFFFASQFDVTEQLEAQEALRQREAELSVIVESAREYAILTIDSQMCITSWSIGAERSFGWKASEILGQAADVIFTAQDRSRGVPGQEVATAAAEGCANDERWHARKDGSPVFMNGSVHPLPADEQGRPRGFIKIARDETERRRSDDRLRETEERYRLAARATNDAVWDWRIADGHVIWNEALADRFGHGVTHTDAQWWLDHIHPDDRAGVDRDIHLVIDSDGQKWSREYRFLRADGSYAHVFDRGHVLRDDEGKPVRMIGAMLDLTERKRAEAELLQANALLSAVMEAVPGVVYAKDVDGRMLAANRGTAELIGQPPSAFLGRTDREFLDNQEQAETVMANDRRIMSTGVPEVLEETISEPDGTPVIWLSTKAPFRDAKGEVIGLVGASMDITDRKNAEAALETRVREALAERHVFADVVNKSTAAVTVLDRDFRIVAVNEASASTFERAFGKRPKIGDRFDELLADKPEHSAQFVAHWSRVLAGEAFTVVEKFGDIELERRSHEARFDVLRDHEGRPIGATSTSYDVTDRVRAEAELQNAQEQLRQSQKMEAMGSLTGGVAHDFNNLLTPIIGSLDMLVRKGVGTERERRLIDGALQSAERAKTLVQRLLAFARRQPLQATAVNIKQLIDGMADLIGSTLGPNIKVRVEVGDDLPPAKADQNQLEMALLNLAVNASDAMPEGGILTIAARRESVHSASTGQLLPGHYICLSVADTGVGMDEATRQRAIEPFFSTKGIGKGTGLGLSMVHGLTAQLGGGLTIESALGDGTTIGIWLPVSGEALQDCKPQEEAPPSPSARGTALLVDDELLVRMSTADMLADLGFEVVEAISGPHALQLVREGLKPDVLITDHLMPGMNGEQLANELKTIWPSLPTLIVSGYAESEGIAPDIPRLVKPFRSSELTEMLWNLTFSSKK